MKIVLALFKYFPGGGLQLDFLRIALELVKRGHRVICCTGSWLGPVPEGLDLRLLPVRRLTNHGKAAALECAIRAFVEKERPDRFVAFNRMGGTDLYFAADNCFLTAFRRKHSVLALKLLPRYRTYLRQEKAVFSPDSKTRILYLVERQKCEFQACYGTQEERFLSLPPGMNEKCRRPENATEIRTARRHELGLAPDELLLLLVASNFQLKGADRVIRAMAHLPERVRNSCRLLLCGDTKIGNFRHLAARCGVEDLLIHLPARQNIPHLMLAADLMVHPARSEAAGSVLAEAIAAGLPLICSGECGFAPIVAAAGGSVLPEPYRDEALLKELTRLTVNPDELAGMKECFIRYGATADFYRRAEVAADAIEKT